MAETYEEWQADLQKAKSGDDFRNMARTNPEYPQRIYHGSKDDIRAFEIGHPNRQGHYLIMVHAYDAGIRSFKPDGRLYEPGAPEGRRRFTCYCLTLSRCAWS